jgi:hypothetical protein
MPLAKRFARVEEAHRAFIQRQCIFFVGSAAAEGRVNISPRGLDTFRVLDPNRVAWLDLTGSGNETAAHLAATGRLTLMFCAFAGPPMILRLYGQGRAHRKGIPAYAKLLPAFAEELPGARQIIELEVDLVQTSCGYAVPLFAYQGDRSGLLRWAEAKGEAGLEAYWREKNARSLDGLPTGMADDPEGT